MKRYKSITKRSGISVNVMTYKLKKQTKKQNNTKKNHNIVVSGAPLDSRAFMSNKAEILIGVKLESVSILTISFLIQSNCFCLLFA